MEYYQPITESEDLPSFVVFYNKENLLRAYPEGKYGTYLNGDIEACRFIDLTPEEILTKADILKYLESLLFINNLDEFKSLLDINYLQEDLAFTAMGYKNTDASTNQWARQDLNDLKKYYVFENNYLHSIDLRDYTEAQLEEEVSSYYEGGLSEIRSTYGVEAGLVIAEIIAENNNQ